MTLNLTHGPGGPSPLHKETVVLAAYQPIKRIVLERRGAALVVVEIEFDDCSPPSSSADSPDSPASPPKGHGVGSK